MPQASIPNVPASLPQNDVRVWNRLVDSDHCPPSRKVIRVRCPCSISSSSRSCPDLSLVAGSSRYREPHALRRALVDFNVSGNLNPGGDDIGFHVVATEMFYSNGPLGEFPPRLSIPAPSPSLGFRPPSRSQQVSRPAKTDAMSSPPAPSILVPRVEEKAADRRSPSLTALSLSKGKPGGLRYPLALERVKAKAAATGYHVLQR
jgi:hypothetical protein